MPPNELKGCTGRIIGFDKEASREYISTLGLRLFVILPHPRGFLLSASFEDIASRHSSTHRLPASITAHHGQGPLLRAHLLHRLPCVPLSTDQTAADLAGETIEAAIIVSVLLSFVEQLMITGNIAAPRPADSPAASSNGENVASEKDDLDTRKTIIRRMRIQIWAGTLSGFFIALCIGAAFIAVVCAGAGYPT